MADRDCGTGFTQKTAAEINLGPLQNNGGPTLSMALRFPSAAIDAGDDASCPATDQCGWPRPHGVHFDIGAYEFQITLEYWYLPLLRRKGFPHLGGLAEASGIFGPLRAGGDEAFAVQTPWTAG